jgi:hypothetical protein
MSPLRRREAPGGLDTLGADDSTRERTAAMIPLDPGISFGFALRKLPTNLYLEKRGNFLLAYSGRSKDGPVKNVEELGAYVAISEEPQPKKSSLLEVAAKFVRSCSPSAEPNLAKSTVGGRAAIVVEWLDGVWRCAAWFVPSKRGKVLVVEALVDPGRHPRLPAKSFGGQLVELIQWLPSTRDPRAVPGASVVRKSVSASSKRDFVLSFSPETPADEILRQAKEAGIGLSRAYLHAIRNDLPKPRGRKVQTPPSNGVNGGWHAPPHGKRTLRLAVDTGLTKATRLIKRLREKLKDPP